MPRSTNNQLLEGFIELNGRWVCKNCKESLQRFRPYAIKRHLDSKRCRLVLSRGNRDQTPEEDVDERNNETPLRKVVYFRSRTGKNGMGRDESEEDFDDSDSHDEEKVSRRLRTRRGIAREEPQIRERSVVRYELDDVPELYKVMLSMVYTNAHPLSILEDEQLRKTQQLTVPQFECPSKNYLIKNVLPLVVNDIEKNIKSYLRKVENVSIAVHCTTSDRTNKKFFAAHIWYTDLPSATAKKIFGTFMLRSENFVSLELRLEKLVNIGQVKHVIANCDSDDNLHSDFFDGPIQLPCLNGIMDRLCQTILAHPRKLVWRQAEIATQNCDQISFSDSSLSAYMVRHLGSLNWRKYSKVINLVFDISRRERDGLDVVSGFSLNDSEFKETSITKAIVDEIQTCVDSVKQSLTVSITIPMLKTISTKVEDLKRENDNIRPLHDVGVYLEEQLKLCEKREEMKLATYLDPRFKDVFFTNPYEPVLEPKFNQFDDEDHPVDVANQSGIEKFLQSNNPATQLTRNERFSQELLLYKGLQTSINTNPAEFWSSQTYTLPLLKAMAMEYLSVPAIAGGEENLIELAEKMCPLTEDNITLHEDLVFCHFNHAQFLSK